MDNKPKRIFGITPGNAGVFLVMGEVLRRGLDTQFPDRNTEMYDMLVGSRGKEMRRVQVRTVRLAPWFVRAEYFKREYLDQVTVYVLLGPEGPEKKVEHARFFMAKNRDVEKNVHYSKDKKTGVRWETGFVSMTTVRRYENRWDALRT